MEQFMCVACARSRLKQTSIRGVSVIGLCHNDMCMSMNYSTNSYRLVLCVFLRGALWWASHLRELSSWNENIIFTKVIASNSATWQVHWCKWMNFRKRIESDGQNLRPIFLLIQFYCIYGIRNNSQMHTHVCPIWYSLLHGTKWKTKQNDAAMHCWYDSSLGIHAYGLNNLQPSQRPSFCMRNACLCAHVFLLFYMWSRILSNLN